MKYYTCMCGDPELCLAKWDEKCPDTCPFLFELDIPDFCMEVDE